MQGIMHNCVWQLYLALCMSGLLDVAAHNGHCMCMLCRAVQAWELLDPPSGWDTSGPVLATGYYHISSTALQMVMLIDDAMAQACHQGERQTRQQQGSEHSTCSRGAPGPALRLIAHPPRA
jgi:hypothetical protein